MKLMIASDLHGSAFYCRQLLAAMEREQPDKLLLLGDILYHGPRNDLPEGYAPKEVIAMLNPLREQLLCVRGNCDTEVDQMVLDFPILADYALLYAGSRTVFATHGHHYNTACPHNSAVLFGNNLSQKQRIKHCPHILHFACKTAVGTNIKRKDIKHKSVRNINLGLICLDHSVICVGYGHKNIAREHIAVGFEKSESSVCALFMPKLVQLFVVLPWQHNINIIIPRNESAVSERTD